MKSISGLSAPLVGLDGEPLKDLVEPGKNPCSACGQVQIPAVFKSTTVAQAIARALIAEEDSKDPVRAFSVAMALHKADDTLDMDADDHSLAQQVLKASKFTVLAKAQCLIVLDAAKQRKG